MHEHHDIVFTFFQSFVIYFRPMTSDYRFHIIISHFLDVKDIFYMLVEIFISFSC